MVTINVEPGDFFTNGTLGYAMFDENGIGTLYIEEETTIFYEPKLPQGVVGDTLFLGDSDFIFPYIVTEVNPDGNWIKVKNK